MFKFLKKLLPTEYVIYENPDRTQIGVTTWEAYLSDKYIYVHQFDTNGKPTQVKHHVWAYSWTSAMKRYYRLYNLGTYKPSIIVIPKVKQVTGK